MTRRFNHDDRGRRDAIGLIMVRQQDFVLGEMKDPLVNISISVNIGVPFETLDNFLHQTIVCS